ncbi:unnamed protein product [Hydatigera taeniaeformis]|uniref:Uncharacterized protein n=1 Tax=Hydatigena taeniaeformis TaxID=6205 RepID=A0A0R3X4P9_HYDTA|nr:unnamed protein product [Hydatigera taeniaeformis]
MHASNLGEITALMKDASLHIPEHHYDVADVTLHCILERLTEASRTSQLSPVEYASRRACILSELANSSLQSTHSDAEKIFVETISPSLAVGMNPKDAYSYSLNFLVHRDHIKVNGKLLVALKSACRIYPQNHENCLNLRVDLTDVESQICNAKGASESLRTAIADANCALFALEQ